MAPGRQGQVCHFACSCFVCLPVAITESPREGGHLPSDLPKTTSCSRGFLTSLRSQPQRKSHLYVYPSGGRRNPTGSLQSGSDCISGTKNNNHLPSRSPSSGSLGLSRCRAVPLLQFTNKVGQSKALICYCTKGRWMIRVANP